VCNGGECTKFEKHHDVLGFGNAFRELFGSRGKVFSSRLKVGSAEGEGANRLTKKADVFCDLETWPLRSERAC
jgi:hypothetical protein